jgi:hypothetical protein
MIRACLVSGLAANLDDAGAADRLPGANLAVFPAVDRLSTFRLDLGLVMGSSEVCAAPSAAPPQPRLGNHPAGQDPKAASAALGQHSNARFEPEGQSILSNLVAVKPEELPPGKREVDLSTLSVIFYRIFSVLAVFFTLDSQTTAEPFRRYFCLDRFSSALPFHLSWKRTQNG